MGLTCDAIIFDLDGVLVDSNAIAERHIRIWADLHKIPFQQIEDLRHGRTTAETIRIAAPHLDAEYEARRIESLEAQDANGLVAFAGATRLLAAINPSRWAIATSSKRDTAMTRLMCVGLPTPRVLVTADDVSNGKPAPDAYLLAAERLGVSAANCVVVEDGLAGIEAGRAAGAYVIGVAATLPAVTLASAHVVLSCLDDLRAESKGEVIVVSWRDQRPEYV